MKKKPVDSYEKPGFFSRIFKKKPEPLEYGYLDGMVPAPEEKQQLLRTRGKGIIPEEPEETEEIVELEGDVCAPTQPEDEEE